MADYSALYFHPTSVAIFYFLRLQSLSLCLFLNFLFVQGSEGLEEVVGRLQAGSQNPETVIEEYLDIICPLLQGDEQFLRVLRKPEEGEEEEEHEPLAADSDRSVEDEEDKENRFNYETAGEGKGFHLESMSCGQTDFTKAENRHLLTRIAAELTQ